MKIDYHNFLDALLGPDPGAAQPLSTCPDLIVATVDHDPAVITAVGGRDLAVHRA